MRKPALVPRLRPFTSTIFAEMTALAVRTEAINLGQGFPDTDGPASMLDAAKDALYGGANQYPPGPGRPELRSAIARHRARYGLEYDPETEILVTAGATEAITAAMLALTEPGDEVIVIEPYYDSYPAAVAMAGATRRVVSLVEDQDGRFALDLEALRAAVTPATRAILVNSPHNPTGTVFTDAELSAIADLCVRNDLFAITDEVYEHLVYDGAGHRPLASFPGMRSRTVSISSAGKTFNCTGWKIGWVCSSAELVGAVKAAKQFITFVSGGPLQPAVARALDHELPWVEGLRVSLGRKRDRLSAGLVEAGFTVHPSLGTYFVCADVRPLGYSDATELAWQLPERVGVVAVPVSVFTDHPDEWKHLLRFAFCKRDEVLDEGIVRLHKLR
ncbi:pyridoxal phosphate-dependent aminotransferase [Amycolatopsis alkalitolerans]|uniref:Pyridoxal phosphate-dependent aminotransferase n=1 Tax=Amycolatopsis alkalitolerans TaxID=2547244 RepID=A0A5C4M7M1_9PSEU|nr:pyridoxal phosphate-dependent aminotransferase [Amycolatopsis alkalitolerans]TNC28516.1 pyridoxal phosphate-dependent aminotransferase [Amycolatopsis alkalitolerans]